jgi:hypothetical protein
VGAPSGPDGGVGRVEWRTDGSVTREEIGAGPHPHLSGDPNGCCIRQGHGRAAVRSRRAVLPAVMPHGRMVAIEAEAQASNRYGDRSKVSACIAVCLRMKIERDPDQDDAGRCKSKQPPMPVYVSQVEHRSPRW